MLATTPFEENVAITKRVVERAHEKGISVEAELGRLGGVEEDIKVDEGSAFLTDPKEAVEFVKETGCDALAAGGTLDPNARGVGEDDYLPAAKLGVTKINIDTDGRLVWTRVHREFFRDHSDQLAAIDSQRMVIRVEK